MAAPWITVAGIYAAAGILQIGNGVPAEFITLVVPSKERSWTWGGVTIVDLFFRPSVIAAITHSRRPVAALLTEGVRLQLDTPSGGRCDSTSRSDNAPSCGVQEEPRLGQNQNLLRNVRRRISPIPSTQFLKHTP